MILQKELTIKELFDELKILKVKLIKLSDKYNHSLIGVKAITYKDVVTNGGYKGDTMLNNLIKREGIKDEFEITLDSYNSYREETIKKIKEMISNESVEYCIVYFRDNLHWKWEDISKVFNYSRSHCHRLYDKLKK